jgi:hypothetical protein
MTGHRLVARGAVLAFALLLDASLVPAQDVTGRPAQKPVRAALAAPRPAAQMAQLELFGGSWSCDGTMAASPFGRAGKMTSTVRAQMDLGGFWQSGVVKGTSPGMPPMEGQFHMTYDTAGKRYLMLWIDNMGGWAQSTSPGWDGETIVFTGESFMAGKRYTTRDTFANGPEGAMRHSWDVQGDSKWLPVGEETCRKETR